MQKHQFKLFADYFQFYIQDDDTQFGDLSEAWTGDATENLLAIGPHVIGIGTARNMDVPVEIQVSEKLPELVQEDWDRINKAKIVCETGRLVVAGRTDYFPDAARVKVHPGTYDVLVAYKNLEELSEDKLDGKDSYHLFLSLRDAPHA